MKENKNLIGISGRLRNGKDLSIELINEILTENNKPTYKRKAFAGKLKEIGSMITGVPMYGWETAEDKATELGPEWNYWTVDVCDINTKEIINCYEYVTKEEAELSFDKIQGSLERNGNSYHIVITERILTRRKFLQRLGSDACNQRVHQNIWVSALFADYKPETYSDRCGWEYPNWMVCDVRFPQELDAIKNRNGKVIRVIRPDKYEHGDVHISETALDNYTDQFDYVVYNDGTIADLKEKLRIIVKELGLI